MVGRILTLLRGRAALALLHVASRLATATPASDAIRTACRRQRRHLDWIASL